jgi:hypothetical protein
MAINTDLVVTGLDFDVIRANLRNYIASKNEFLDYDFNDSALGTLLDLLAYNTYYNGFYANMLANESFLDTAQNYDSVVSLAKALGYTPTSARGASANVKVTFTLSVANTTFRSITVPKNTAFLTQVNGSSYKFVTPQSYTITANTNNGFSDYITITEGEPLTHQYVFNSTTNTAFVLPNDMVDTSSITVTVTASGNTQTYIPADDIFTVNSSAQVYFVEADRNQKYKIAFGDGVLGYQPPTGSIVGISYRVCNGKLTNGANSFNLINTTIDGQNAINIQPIGRASGGADIEGIESIRFNAPRIYETQNRCVTSEDYKRLILDQNPDVSSINVWGGEENDPPIYGKVFVAAKPKTGSLFSANRKEQIIASIRKYNVQSVDVDMVDPTYLYIVPYITVRFNPKQTTKTPGELAAAISSRVVSFEENYMSSFGKSFRFSRFLDYLDSTDEAIQTTEATIRLRKTFTPNLSGVNSYVLKFNNALQRLGTKELIAGNAKHPGYGGITSSTFAYGGNDASYFDDNGFGTMRIYYPSTAGQLNRVYVNYTAGTVDYAAGVVNIDNFVPTSYTGDVISIIAAPVSPNITPVRNQILLMSQCEVNVVDDNTGLTLATASSVETVGQTATLLTPSIKLYNF